MPHPPRPPSRGGRGPVLVPLRDPLPRSAPHRREPFAAPQLHRRPPSGLHLAAVELVTPRHLRAAALDPETHPIGAVLANCLPCAGRHLAAEASNLVGAVLDNRVRIGARYERRYARPDDQERRRDQRGFPPARSFPHRAEGTGSRTPTTCPSAPSAPNKQGPHDWSGRTCIALFRHHGRATTASGIDRVSEHPSSRDLPLAAGACAAVTRSTTRETTGTALEMLLSHGVPAVAGWPTCPVRRRVSAGTPRTSARCTRTAPSEFDKARPVQSDGPSEH